MKNIFLPFFCLFFAAYVADAQTVTWSTPGCGTSSPNLQMVVFQGCTPSEGTKEFVHFTTGTSPWNVSELSITGSQNSTVSPNGPCIATGFSGNLSASIALNTIAGCGTLFEAAPVTIPPNSKVLVIPNVAGAFATPPYQGSITAAQLAPLCGKGPIYVVANTALPGCLNGIFANVNPACPSNCNRNIIINFGGGCVATINYDIDDPTMPSPTAQGVNFTPGCNITGAMTNSPWDCFPKPCEIPDVTVSVNPSSKLCANSTQQINFTLNTNAPLGSSYSWSGPQGFSSSASNPTVNPSPALPVGNHVYNVTVCVPGGCSKSTSVTVTIIDNPLVVTASVNPTSTLCINAAQSIKLTANVAGAPSAITYAWSGNTAPPFSSSAGPNTAHNPSPSLPAGTYTYTVTATSVGCSRTASTNVSITNGLFFTAQPDLTICGSAATPFSVTPTPNATATYVWLGPNLSATTGANVTATPNAPTLPTNVISANYKVTVTENGCSWSDDFNIVVFAPTTGATILPVAPVCKGTPFNLSATGSVPTGSTYSWSGPSSFTSPAQNPLGISTTGLAAGVHVYTLSVTNGPCVTTLNTSVTVTASLTFNDIVDITVCGTGPFPIAVTPNPSGSATYNWTGPGVSSATDATINATPTAPPSSNNYNVTVTDNGCIWTDNFRIINSSPTSAAVITVLPNICKGRPFNMNVTGAPAGSTYSWSSPNGFTSTSAINIGLSSTTMTAGTHDYTVTITNGPCTTTLTTTVTITDAPNISTNITGSNTICPNSSAVLSASGNFSTYKWNTGETSASITISSGGLYVVTVGDGSGCNATASKSVSILNTPNPVISGATSICQGASTTLAVNGTYNAYQWSNGSNNQTIIVNTAGQYNVTVTDSNGCKGVASVNVTSSGTLNVAITGNPNFCTGKSAMLSVGAGFSTYLWDSGETTSSINTTTSGIHSVTVSNGLCTGTASVIVNQVANPIVTIIGDKQFCKGGATTLSIAGNNNSYIWSNSSGSTSSINVSDARTYSVTVTDVNGCTGTASIVVTEYATPTPTINGPSTLCGTMANTTLSLNQSYTSYLWSNLSMSNILTISGGGTYSVTVTDANGCSAVATKTITQSGSLSPKFVNNTNVICGNATTTLTLDEPYATYQWNTGQTSATLVATTGGTYSVTVTNTSGCTGVAATTVAITNAPIFTPIPNLTICGSDPISLLVTGTPAPSSSATYAWATSTSGATITPTTSAVPSATPKVNTLISPFTQVNNYTVTVTETNGCKWVDTFTITTNPPPIIANVLTPMEICTGERIKLSFTSGTLPPPFFQGQITGWNYPLKFVWTGPNSYSTTTTSTTAPHSLMVSPSATSAMAGVYSLVVSSPSISLHPSCSSLPVNITVNVLPTDTIRLQKILCSGIVGTFVDILKQQNGCDSVIITTVKIATKLNVVISEQNKVLTINSTLSGVTYQWLLNEKAIVGANSTAFTAFVDGLYCVEITDVNGCTHKSNTIQIGQVATSDIAQSNIRIYPNPTTGLCRIDGDEDFVKNALLVNLLGQKYSLQIIDNQIDISVFPNGIYQLFLQNKEGKSFCAKLIKQ